MKYCDGGILITSNKVIHDITSINEQFKFNPHMKSLFGIIHSDYINKLLLDYDKNGPSKLNPFPILDPSRVNGINYDHPFIKELIKIPKDRLDLILQELEVEDDNEYIFFNNEIMDIINKLNITGDKFMESNDLMKFTENKNSNLIRGIESDRGKYVTVEKNFLQNLNKSKRVNLKPDINKKKPEPYKDPMSKLFEIIGVGDEGNAATEEKDKTNLYKQFDKSINSNIETEEKKIFCFNNVDGKENNDVTNEFESQNYQHLKKDNLFVIKFIESTQDRKYEIYQSGQKIILKININFPILKRYFSSDSEFSKENETSKLEAIVFLHEILTEALTRIQLISYINRDFIKINNSSSSVNFQELFKNYDSYKNNIDISVDKVIQNIIGEERMKIKKLINSPFDSPPRRSGGYNSNIKNTISDVCSDNIIDLDNSITNSDQFIDSSQDQSNESNFFIKALNNIEKINEPDKLNHTLGFEEHKITNNQKENNGLNSFLLKDKTDKLINENEKLNKEILELKKQNQELKIDVTELKEILIDDIDNKVVKRFKRIERFIDYKFKNKEIINDFLIFYDIKIIYLSKALHLKKNLIQKYNFNNYNNSQDINKPILFYGVYRDYDIEIIKNHKGLKYIYWDDNDANINYENRRANLLELSNLATMNLCGTMIVEKYLQIMNIDYKKIEF